MTSGVPSHDFVYAASASPTYFFGMPLAAADSASICVSHARSRHTKYAPASAGLVPHVMILAYDASQPPNMFTMTQEFELVEFSGQVGSCKAKQNDVPVILKNEMLVFRSQGCSKVNALCACEDHAAEARVY